MNSLDLSAAFEATQFIRSGFLSAEDKRALTDIATTATPLRAGVDRVSEGEPTNHIHFLVRGWAARYKTVPSGARQITGLILPGDLCNLDSFMLDEINFGVRTLTAASVVTLPRDRVRVLGAERPGITRAFTWFAIVENAVLSEWALSIGRQTARERLARLLCEISKRLESERENKASFELPITQEQIGDMLGLTPVHVNRTLKQLRMEKLIAAESRRVTAADMAALRRVGGFNAMQLQINPAMHGTSRR